MKARWSVAALLLAAPLFSQSPAVPSRLTANVDVKVINVDVLVIDAAGKPVTDLTQGDFTVLEDNQPQAITNFFIARHSGVSAGPHDPSDAQLRRRIVLLVDNNYIDKSDRDAALRKLDEFVDGTFDGSYEWALGMIGQQLEIVQTLTTDKVAIHSAIGKIRKSATTTFRDMMDRSMLDDPLYQRSGLDIPAGFESRERTKRSARSLANTARGLVDAAHAFATVEGKKLAVLLTGSMDLNTTFAAYDSGSDRELQDAKLGTGRMIDSIVREANAANMSIHVVRAAAHSSAAPQHDVDNRGSGSGIEGINITAESDIRDTSSEYTLAAGTGGLYLSSNAVRQSFDSIDAAAQTFYLLGYRPGHAEDGQYHRIAVRVNRAGARISYRQGYLDISAEERLEQLLQLRISALQPASAVPVKLDLTDLGGSGSPAVAVIASMPMSKVTFLSANDRFVGRVHVYLSIFDSKGLNVGFHHKVQDLSFSPAEHDQTAAESFRYRMNVRLDRGDFTLAVTLRDDLSNEIGTAVQKIKL